MEETKLDMKSRCSSLWKELLEVAQHKQLNIIDKLSFMD